VIYLEKLPPILLKKLKILSLLIHIAFNNFKINPKEYSLEISLPSNNNLVKIIIEINILNPFDGNHQKKLSFFDFYTNLTIQHHYFI
jgi:hypothetical protein